MDNYGKYMVVKLHSKFKKEKVVVNRNIGDFDIYEIPGSQIFPDIGSKILKHDFKFKSSYKEICNDEPLFTNYTQRFVGCLDYIFVSDNINVKHVKRMPKFVKHLETGIEFENHIQNKTDINSDNQEELNQFLPNKNYPSDHLPIVSVVEF